MVSLYDILGIKESASQEEVKRAYRKKARAAHPDKGGDQASMAMINRAYMTLKDPTARLTYDQTGEEANLDQTERAARDILIELFNELLHKRIEQNCIGHIRNAIQARLGQFQTIKTASLDVQKYLKRRRDKIKARKGPNLFHAIVDDELRRAAFSLADIERKTQWHLRALELLDDYESIEELQNLIPFGLSQQTGFNMHIFGNTTF